MKKNTKKGNAKKLLVPFMAQLLTQQEMQHAAAGATSPLRDTVHTMKYPSDSDEGGI